MSDTPWSHFSHNELACPCCGRMEMDSLFMGKLSALRHTFGKPLKILSGFRCPQFNAQSSSTGFSGPHITGKAANIAISGADAHRLLTLALQNGFTGVGVANGYLHLDTIDNSPGRPRPALWNH